MFGKKKLYIVRHAKSTWEYENISDLDRPLKHRGISDAYEMARRLKIDCNVPDYFISSPANRALHTASIFLQVFEVQHDKLRIESKLYGQGAESVLDVIKHQPDGVSKLMIFGHNPDLSELARMFASGPFFEMPTCGLAIFTFFCDQWSRIGTDNLAKEFFDFPSKEVELT